MPVNDNDIRVKRTKKLIRQGLAELAKTKRLSKITVKELTDLVEINRGTFYLHYKDIADLVETIENTLYNDLQEFTENVTPKNIMKNPIDILEQYANFVRDNKDAFTMFMGPHGDAEFMFKLSALLDEKIYELCISLYPNMNKNVYEFALDYCKFGAVGLVNCWVSKHPEWTSRQVAEYWYHLMINGIMGAIENKPKGV